MKVAHVITRFSRQPTYIDRGNELDGLSVLAKLFTLDVLEDLHAVTPDELSVESICCETARPITLLAPFARLLRIEASQLCSLVLLT